MIWEVWDYLAFSLPIFFGFIYLFRNRETNPTIQKYFQSEGKLNWFVAGTAMVATTFAADTPLAVTELVREKGVSGNWIWWSLAIGGLVTVFFFAPLWRRSGAKTDLELLTLRYSGKGMTFLRGFKAIGLGFVINCIVLGWVHLAMAKILSVFFPGTHVIWMLCLAVLIGFLYTSIAGLTGISKIDVFQFFLAWGGCLFYAILVVGSFGGLSAISSRIPLERLNFFPDFSRTEEFWSAMILITFVWWSSWYPGSEPGGGGYIAQRILATPNEKNALLSSLWFVFLHYFVRPWPWILVALVALVLYPNLTAEESGKAFLYPLVDLGYGIKGLLFIAFISAYLSTLATHLNWGASYLVLDLFKGILIPGRSDKFYFSLSYASQLITAVVSTILALYGMDTIKGAWEFLISASSGLGFVLMARWFYWRISAWSELLSLVLSPLIYFVLRDFFSFPWIVPFVSVSTAFLILVLTPFFPQTEQKVLDDFFQKVRPPSLFWKGYGPSRPFGFWISTYCVLAGIVFLFSGLGFVGSLLGFYNSIFLTGFIFGVSGILLYFLTIQKLNIITRE